MPTRQLRTTADSMKIAVDYGLDRWLGFEPIVLASFAAWLCDRALVISTEEIAIHVRQFIAIRSAALSRGEDFDSGLIQDGEGLFLVTRAYERQVNDLMWLVRTARSALAGADAWRLVAKLSVTAPGSREELARVQPPSLLQDARCLVARLADLRLEVVGGVYSPGQCDISDDAILRDLLVLDETLGEESLWRDTENLSLPGECVALAHLTADSAMLNTLDRALLVDGCCR